MRAVFFSIVQEMLPNNVDSEVMAPMTAGTIIFRLKAAPKETGPELEGSGPVCD